MSEQMSVLEELRGHDPASAVRLLATRLDNTRAWVRAAEQRLDALETPPLQSLPARDARFWQKAHEELAKEVMHVAGLSDDFSEYGTVEAIKRIKARLQSPSEESREGKDLLTDFEAGYAERMAGRGVATRCNAESRDHDEMMRGWTKADREVACLAPSPSPSGEKVHTSACRDGYADSCSVCVSHQPSSSGEKLIDCKALAERIIGGYAMRPDGEIATIRWPFEQPPHRIPSSTNQCPRARQMLADILEHVQQNALSSQAAEVEAARQETLDRMRQSHDNGVQLGKSLRDIELINLTAERDALTKERDTLRGANSAMQQARTALSQSQSTKEQENG